MSIFTILKLKSRDPEKRYASIYKIGSSKNKKYLKYILQALKDEDPGVRSAAAHSLGELGDNSVTVTDQLVGALEDTNFGVWKSAAISLRKFEWKPIKEIDVLKLDIAAGNWKNLPNSRITIDLLLDIVKGEPPKKIYYNGKLVENHYMKAIAMLSEIGKNHVEYLSKLIDRSKSNWQKIALVEVLGNIGGNISVQILTKLLYQDNEAIIKKIILIFADYKSELTYSELIKLFYDKRRDIRIFSVGSVGKKGNEKFIPALEKLLSDTDKDIREMALFSLNNLGWKPFDNFDEVLPLIKKKDIESIKKMGEKAIAPILHALEHSIDYGVVSNAIEILGYLKEKRATCLLINALSKEGTSIAQDKTAIIALGNIGDARGFNACLQCLEFNSISELAIKSLEQILISEPSAISEDELRTVMEIKEVNKDVGYFNGTKFVSKIQSIDLTRLKALSMKELQNRLQKHS